MSQSSKLKRLKLTTNPGEPFEKEEEITNEMDGIMETILSTCEEAVMSSSSGKSADELAHNVSAWWGEVDNQNTSIVSYDEDIDENM